jgi:outer membrane protein assembly factor BamB
MFLAAQPADDPHNLGWLNENPSSVNWLKEDKPHALPPVLPLAVDHSAHMPPVGSQETQGSCTAWALCYYYKTYQEWLEHGWSVLDSAHRFSPSFAYNQANRGGDIGSYASDIMKVLVDQGCANLLDCPYRTADHTSWPSETAYYRALPYRAQDAYWIDCRTDPGIENLKAHIAGGDNAVLGFWVWGNFDNINNYDTVYCVADRTGNNRGGHQICLLGYDDARATHDGPGAFRLVNSWGTGWGNRGYAWMSYVAVKNSQLSGQWACYVTDRIAYSPSTVARYRAGHAKREWISLTAGIGPTSSPYWTKDFYNWQLAAQAGNPFPDHDVLLDLSDGAAQLNASDTNGIFIEMRDNLADGVTGDIRHLSAVNNTWGAYSRCPDTFVPILDDATPAFAGLRFPTQSLHWPFAHRWPGRAGFTELTGDLDSAVQRWAINVGSQTFTSPTLGDLNADGRQEIVTGSNSLAAIALKGNGDTLWSFPVAQGAGTSSALGDVDGDGRLEVIIGNYNDTIYALNGEDGSRLWAFGTGGPVASAPILSDLDGDGRLEAVFGSFDHSVYALNAESGFLLWSYLTAADISNSPAVADIDGDGEPEVIIGSSDGKLYALNGADGSLLWSRTTGDAIRSTACVGDIDGDGEPEVVFGSADDNLYAVRGANDSLLWSFTSSDDIVSSPALADIDHDGRLEIVVGGNDGSVHALNGEDGSPFWSHPTGGFVVSSPAIGDVNGDGNLEVVVGGNDSTIYCLNGSDGAQAWASRASCDVGTSPALGDIDGDGRLEVVVASGDGNVYVLDGTTSAVNDRPSRFAGHSSHVLLTVIPNPFSQTALIQYSLPVASNIQLNLYDPTGRLVLRLATGYQAAGNHVLRISDSRLGASRLATSSLVASSLAASSLGHGIYFCRLTAGNQTLNQKVLIVQ